MLVVDDQLLLAVLSGIAPGEVTAGATRGEVFTTGSWYYRLGRAVTAGSGSGSLSGRFQALAEPVRSRVQASLEELPDEIGLLSLRVVVPVMQAFQLTRPTNFLTAEALGAALLLDAEVAVTTDAPLLRAGCVELAIGYRVVAVP
ncbi:MAG TPA: hypothetical protein VNQ73_09395 [Ilumatobacter sp.]|nr:hypothetical protein [Ilumatobacter sp.]